MGFFQQLFSCFIFRKPKYITQSSVSDDESLSTLSSDWLDWTVSSDWSDSWTDSSVEESGYYTDSDYDSEDDTLECLRNLYIKYINDCNCINGLLK